jgi:simple sugar transport system permease protein
VSLFLALLALVVYWFISRRTAFGYEIRVLGENPKAAVYAGIPTKRNILLVMTIAGAFAGLGGALHLMGQFPYQMIATTSRIDQTGFDAIGASLLGMNTAVGALFGSLLFGGLRAASPLVQASGISGDIVLILEALVLFCIASEFLPVLRRVLPRWLQFRPRQPRPETVPLMSTATSLEPLSTENEYPAVPVDVGTGESVEESAGGDGASPKED